MAKLTPPAVSASDLGPVDAVLLSHDDHHDNFDITGRRWAVSQVPLILTNSGAATRLGAPALGLAPWRSTELPRADRGGNLTVTAVPAVHGPLDGTRDESGHVNAQVTGFVLQASDLPTVYVSGDNASALGVPRVVIAHIAGWSIYSEGLPDVRTAFDEAGIADRIVDGEVRGRCVTQRRSDVRS
jgi:L-ascorbate metabolism protein UlaG (beta-lactamase superfamily)